MGMQDWDLYVDQFVLLRLPQQDLFHAHRALLSQVQQ
eukprot:gene16344-4986_t